eukprot:3778058-Pyramimonas_sp.AAC.1
MYREPRPSQSVSERSSYPRPTDQAASPTYLAKRRDIPTPSAFGSRAGDLGDPPPCSPWHTADQNDHTPIVAALGMGF